MNCRNALYLLLTDKEVHGASASEITAAKEHLLSCKACRTYVENNKKIKHMIINRLAGDNPAPASLKNRILDSIRESGSSVNPPGTTIRKRYIITAITVIFILTIFSVYKFTISGDPSGSIVDQLTAEHVEYIKGQDMVQISSSDPYEIEEWFRDKTDFLLNVPRLNGAKLVGARLCQLFDRKIGVLVYESSNELVSLFVFNYPGLDLSSMDMLDIDGKKLCRGHGKGVHIVMWERGGLVYALASQTREMELLRLASGTE